MQMTSSKNMDWVVGELAHRGPMSGPGFHCRGGRPVLYFDFLVWRDFKVWAPPLRWDMYMSSDKFSHTSTVVR